VIGGRFVERDAQELSQAQAIGAPPGDPALTVNDFEVTYQEHPKVHAGRNRRLPALFVGRVMPLTAAFDPAVELGLGQQLVELLIEGMPRRFGQSVGQDEQSLLPPPPLAHRHRCALRAVGQPFAGMISRASSPPSRAAAPRSTSGANAILQRAARVRCRIVVYNETPAPARNAVDSHEPATGEIRLHHQKLHRLIAKLTSDACFRIRRASNNRRAFSCPAN
jgi:hypothetical protein